jgi:hypothetical protein
VGYVFSVGASGFVLYVPQHVWMFCLDVVGIRKGGQVKIPGREEKLVKLDKSLRRARNLEPIRAAIEALKPFAKAIEQGEPHEWPHVTVGVLIKMKDLRRAKEALETLEKLRDGK